MPVIFLDALPVTPNADLGLVARLIKFTFTLLLTVHKTAFIPPPVSPPVHPLTLSYVLMILTLIRAPVRPTEFTETVHFVHIPLTNVDSTIVVKVGSLSVLLIFRPFPYVLTAIQPNELSVAIFHTNYFFFLFPLRYFFYTFTVLAI